MIVVCSLLFYREDEAILTRCIFNFLEFGGIKIRIIHRLPDAEKFDGVLVGEPFLYKCDTGEPFRL